MQATDASKPTTLTGNAKMTTQQAFELAMAICQNEKKEMSEISDSQIGYYLADRDIEETAENIAMIRNA